MRLIYHPDAEAELLDAIRFYTHRVRGLGSRFLSDFELAIKTISEAPDRWPVVESDVRRYVMRRFPYGIYYRIDGDDLRILVVKHHSRHPDYWTYRLDE
jgi:plasmid stabilization system protein ParE